MTRCGFRDDPTRLRRRATTRGPAMDEHDRDQRSEADDDAQPDEVVVRTAHAKGGRQETCSNVACDGWSIVGGVLKRGRDVSARVEESPEVHEFVAFHVEHEVRVPSDRKCSKTWQAEFVCEAQRAKLGAVAGALRGPFDGVDELEGDVIAGFAEVRVDCRFEVGCGEVAESNGSGRHRLRCPLRFGRVAM